MKSIAVSVVTPEGMIALWCFGMSAQSVASRIVGTEALAMSAEPATVGDGPRDPAYVVLNWAHVLGVAECS